MLALSLPIMLTLLCTGLTRLAFGLPAGLLPRVSQQTDLTTQNWETACRGGGGGKQCRQLSVLAFPTLLAAAPPCNQQDATDDLIDFAKRLNNNTAAMIKFAQLFVQQPRNTVRRAAPC